MRWRLFSCSTLLVFSTLAGRAAATFIEVGRLPQEAPYTTVEIQFVGPSDGWAHNLVALWRTRDGGSSWTNLSLPEADLRAEHFDSIDAGWIVVAADEFSPASLYRLMTGVKPGRCSPSSRFFPWRFTSSSPVEALAGQRARNCLTRRRNCGSSLVVSIRPTPGSWSPRFFTLQMEVSTG